MTGRSVPEWVGRTPDTDPPPRVKDRVIRRQEGVCGCGCGTPFGQGKDAPEFDHRLPLEDGGENRETNLQALRRLCHNLKTAREALQRTKERRVRKKHLGIETKARSAIPGSKWSKWKRKLDGTTVRRNEE